MQLICNGLSLSYIKSLHYRYQYTINTKYIEIGNKHIENIIKRNKKKIIVSKDYYIFINYYDININYN
jgi:hypothetical protein